MFSKKLIGALGVGIFGLGMTASAAPADAAIFGVNNINDSGGGSLRSAINAANGTAVKDQIRFDILGPGPHVIALNTDLPFVTQPVAIRGYTEPSSSEATLNSAANPSVVIDATNSGSGLRLNGDGIEVRGLVIRDAVFDGIFVTGNNNVVAGNYLGTNSAGDAAQPNGQYGLHVDGNNNEIGGPNPADRNLVSGNAEDGVRIHTGTGNVVEGNYLGTDETGTADLGAGTGALIESSQNTVKNNLASGGIAGVTLEGDDNTVQGNKIGTDVTGSVALGNLTGLIVFGSERNQIGGPEVGDENLVSGNLLSGVAIVADNGDPAEDNNVEGNLIGTDSFGTAPLPNGDAGVLIGDSNANHIGGETVSSGNVISGNAADGVRMISDSRDNKVQANWIGTDENDADLGNGESGVEIEDGADNRVGASSSLKPSNVIAHNGDDGVTVESGVGNAIVRNSLYDNGGLGIDLNADGTTANDGALDPDAGPNTLQNGPEIDEVVAGKVVWDLETEADTTYRLEFFVSDACDPSGSGEGQTHVKTLQVDTNGNGDADSDGAGTPITAAAGQQVTMTATKLGNNNVPLSTSELSPCEVVQQ